MSILSRKALAALVGLATVTLLLVLNCQFTLRTSQALSASVRDGGTTYQARFDTPPELSMQVTQSADLADCHVLAGPLAWSPSWSPDGTQIAFLSQADDHAVSQLYIMNPDGSHQRRLSYPEDAAYGVAVGPLWSPDSTHIAYVVTKRETREFGYQTWLRLYVTTPEHSDERIVFTESPGDFHMTMPIDTPRVGIPSWSPDSKQIALPVSTDRFFSTIAIINADGSGSAAVPDKNNTANLGHLNAASRRVSWSPTGSELALVGGGIDVLNVDGTNLRRLVEGPVDSMNWLPDGKQIVFPIYSDKLRGTYIVDMNGTIVRRLPLPADAGLPKWSPDGKSVAFDVRIVSYQDLFLMSNDMSTEQQVTYGRTSGGTFSWSDDSKQIVFANDGFIYVVNTNALCRVP